MAIIKICNKRSFKRSLMYIGRDHVTLNGEKKPAAYTSGILCSDDTKGAVQDFWLTQKSYNKISGRSAIEIIQSCPSSDKVTAEQVHQIGLELAHELGKLPYIDGYQMFLATHTDQRNGNLHNHLAINAVSLETGAKIQLPPDALPTIKAVNDKICRAHGLSVPTKGRTVQGEERDTPTANKTNTYAVLAAAERDDGEDSYIRDIAVKVIDVSGVATSRADFVARLERQGVGVVWSDTRKYITFEDLKRKAHKKKKYKVRDKKLSQYYNLEINKEVLENGIKANAERIAAAERARKQLDSKINGSIGAIQSGQQPVTAAVTGTARGKQQSESGVSTSLQADTGLEQLRLAAQGSAAAQAERQRRLREQQAAEERRRAAEAAKRAERKRAEQERAATPKTATKSRSKGYSIGD